MTQALYAHMNKKKKKKQKEKWVVEGLSEINSGDQMT
jgi:hypothetical protein